eukprot:NODE_856_length_1153_cov_71.329435_g814_i0.p1 GENE.NODE_856_length_1153_cov_71.329435_g814_i0~~NODE_856_length_1153_cov_71.329435_g814_i0.p1  ORF type:complete len:337 (-),score=52.17 NODE_856_length_1153_cov_71.329435_g814_i0:69-1079(-)
MTDEFSDVETGVDEPTPEFPPIPLNNFVGFESLTNQWKKKQLKRGFDFNLMVVGHTGLGKSTFVNSLFSAHLVDSKGSKKAGEPIRQTTEISVQTHLVEEEGVKLRLSVIDTPGFGEQLDNEKCWEPISKYIQKQYALYHKQESAVNRKKFIRDSRVHCLLYFLTPGHALKPIDIETMANLCDIVNLVPVIGKSDALTISERQSFKKRVMDQINHHKIRLYPAGYSDYDQEDMAVNESVNRMLPFAVVGSETTIVVAGKAVRGRKTRCGTINIEDESHCEFVQLRNFLMRTHLQDMIEVTQTEHYESYRTLQLSIKKEKKDDKKKGAKTNPSKARI